MSQIELARRIGKSHTYVGRRLSGETAFDTDDLERIAGILGVSVVDLLPDSALGPTGLRGRMPIAPASLPDRPSDRRGPTRPGSHRPPSGPGRTSRLAVS
jgi:transcriptional regulator with XRE-family HTH domain